MFYQGNHKNSLPKDQERSVTGPNQHSVMLQDISDESSSHRAKGGGAFSVKRKGQGPQPI